MLALSRSLVRSIRCHQAACRLIALPLLAVWLSGCRPTARPSLVILAPDVTIHLGDDRSPPAGWIALYNRLIPSPVWVATFYLPDSRGAWELSALVQAGREPINEILLNGRPVEPRYVEASDPIDRLAWRVITATVASGVVHPGANEILVRVGQHPPFRQRAGDVWDDLQFRGILLAPLAD